MAARKDYLGSPPTRFWLILAIATGLAAIAIWGLIDHRPDSTGDPPPADGPRYREQLLTPENSQPLARAVSPVAAVIEPQPQPPRAEITAASNNTPVWRVEPVRPGDSFTTIMQRLGYAPAVVAKVMDSGPHAQQLTHLKPNHQLQLLDHSQGLEKLRYEIDRTTRLEIDLAAVPPKAQTIELPVETRMQHTAGRIDSSLYLAGKAAGLADPLIMELANIFGWDVDFTLDLRKGDRFTVIYSELFLNGAKIDNGKIFAAELSANGRPFRAVYYENSRGKGDYYSPQGNSMRKVFSRNPLPITRITSRFNPNRLHPIFKTRRPHRGVDYGAASGTPVRATGDGKVIFRGRKNGYGNTMIIQHGQRYTTLYAHLKSYARSVKQGTSVRQGKTIAYVGQSGWATGPHLHYEFRVNGVHHNPLTVKLPPAKPVAKAEKQRFLTQVSPYLTQLDSLANPQLAGNLKP